MTKRLYWDITRKCIDTLATNKWHVFVFFTCILWQPSEKARRPCGRLEYIKKKGNGKHVRGNQDVGKQRIYTIPREMHKFMVYLPLTGTLLWKINRVSTVRQNNKFSYLERNGLSLIGKIFPDLNI